MAIDQRLVVPTKVDAKSAKHGTCVILVFGAPCQL
jgi:hypothetical protein